MKIICTHGAFDFKNNRRNGFSILVDKIRFLAGEASVLELDHLEQTPSLQSVDEFFIHVGYSNGFHDRMNDLEFLNHMFPRTQNHLIGVDGVHEGGGFLSSPWLLGSNVLTCLYFLRTQNVQLPPWHQTIVNPLEPILYIDSGHAGIIETLEVHELILQRIFDLLKGASL